MLFRGRNFSFWIRGAIFAGIIQLSGCFPGFLEPDCGGILDVVVSGAITDEQSNPISGAMVKVASLKKNSCTGSQPLPEFTLITDQSGSFSGVIPVIYIDDVLRIEISAEGFNTRLYDPATYVFFDEALAIVLNKEEPLD